jgi:UDP-2,4-diacetamido-2,4,6-trideoxy-beta-L-altropyranose hydrolase
MKIAFRVDGNKTLGLGHVKRCISIANNLKNKKIQCFFITQFKQTKKLLESKGFIVFLINKQNEYLQINQILVKESCHKLVIDSKRKSIKYLLKNFNKNFKIILIDVYSNDADLVIFSSLKKSEYIYPKNSLVGTKYILHGIEKLPLQSSKKDNSILITMGGTDKNNISENLVNSFAKSNLSFNLVIVLGEYYTHENNLLKIIKNDPRFQIIKSPSSLTSLMQKASIGIISFGITVYETAICQLPSFVISHSDENDLAAKFVENFGWISYIGKYNEIKYDEIPKMTFNLINDQSKLQKMIQSCKQIDGLGPSNVAKSIIDL